MPLISCFCKAFNEFIMSMSKGRAYIITFIMCSFCLSLIAFHNPGVTRNATNRFRLVVQIDSFRRPFWPLVLVRAKVQIIRIALLVRPFSTSCAQIVHAHHPLYFPQSELIIQRISIEHKHNLLLHQKSGQATTDRLFCSQA